MSGNRDWKREEEDDEDIDQEIDETVRRCYAEREAYR